MTDQKIDELHRSGQSLWLDNIRRDLVDSGELARLRDLGVTGVTSNPTIFERAVTGSSAYDEALQRLGRDGLPAAEILWELMVEDIQSAADVFRPVYDEGEGRDGFVSIEVAPAVAASTPKTIAMAEDLRRRCERPNVMVKIPATAAGIGAIRDQIGKGHNINVTLIFSVDRYREVVEAFLRGLEDLLASGGDVSRVASVASFFVSRVDTKVDQLLVDRPQQTSLYGRAGIANSKLAYQVFKSLHSGPRWERLHAAGARVQRCLWASTSTKDARYPDTMYVDGLIGAHTVNTVPDSTLRAFLDHGSVQPTLEEDLDGARGALDELARLGIDLRQVTAELEVEGVAAFEKSYENLTATLHQAAAALVGGTGKPSGR